METLESPDKIFTFIYILLLNEWIRIRMNWHHTIRLLIYICRSYSRTTFHMNYVYLTTILKQNWRWLLLKCEQILLKNFFKLFKLTLKIKKNSNKHSNTCLVRIFFMYNFVHLYCFFFIAKFISFILGMRRSVLLIKYY